MPPVVLLVDDDENLLHGLVRLLRRQPYVLCTARSAEEAMWAFKAHPIDVVVSDDRMPGLSGMDLLAWVAESFPDVMRIVLTGHASVESALRAINDATVYRYFTKPCSEVELALCIRDALDERTRRQAALR